MTRAEELKVEVLDDGEEGIRSTTLFAPRWKYFSALGEASHVATTYDFTEEESWYSHWKRVWDDLISLADCSCKRCQLGSDRGKEDYN